MLLNLSFFTRAYLIKVSILFEFLLATGRKKAIVANARNDLTSRQIFMYEQFKDRVGINKIRNHFLCKLSARRNSRTTNTHSIRNRILLLNQLSTFSLGGVNGISGVRRARQGVYSSAHE